MAKRKQKTEEGIITGGDGQEPVYSKEELEDFGLAEEEQVSKPEIEQPVKLLEEEEPEQEMEEEEEEYTEPGDNGHQAQLTREEIEAFEEKEMDKDIPGKGYLFHVKKKHLPEATRLNDREIIGFSVGEVQQAVLDHSRTESLFDIFKNGVFQKKIAFQGEGRKENIILHQLSAEERESSRGGMFGSND